MMTGHAIECTSPKGGPFIGTCIKCGKPNLTFNQARKRCENVANLTDAEAFKLILEGPKNQ